MKSKKIFSLILAVVMCMTFGMSNVYADNKEEVASGEIIEDHNSGNIGINHGTIKKITNTGTLGVNDTDGVVEINNGSIGITRNDGLIKTNNGPVNENYGTIEENYQTVVMKKGGKVNNNKQPGKLLFEAYVVTEELIPCDGSVDVNDGIIEIKNGTVNVGTNNGTIYLYEKANLTVSNNTENASIIKLHDDVSCTCTANTGYIGTELYKIIFDGAMISDAEEITCEKYDGTNYYTPKGANVIIKISDEYTITNDGTTLYNENMVVPVTNVNDEDKTFTITFHKHTLGSYIKTDTEKHWKECSETECAGSHFSEASHTFGNYVSNNDATYESDGTKTRTCTVCGRKETVDDPGSMLKHSSKKHKKTENKEEQNKDSEKEKEQDQDKEQEQKINTFNDLPINDKTSYDWAKKSIYKLVEDGIINGYEDNTYKPECNIKRDEFVKLICLVLNIKEDKTYVNKFVDIDDNWAKDKIIALAHHEIINGYDEIHFGPSNNLTNEQMVSILIKGIKYLNKDILITNESDIELELNKISDKELISPWAKQNVATAIKYGLLTGDDNKNINPTSNTTRAQVAVIIERYQKLIEEIKN